MSEYLHQWSHWVTGHPHIQFLFMCPVKNYIIIGCLPRQMTLVSPPPDGEMSLPTSVGHHRHPPQHSWRHELHETARMWRRSVDGQERMVATVWRDSRSSGSGPMHDNKQKSVWHTATRVSHYSLWTGEVCQPQSRRVVTCWNWRGFTICNSKQRNSQNLVAKSWTLFNTPTQGAVHCFPS